MRRTAQGPAGPSTPSTPAPPGSSHQQSPSVPQQQAPQQPRTPQQQPGMQREQVLDPQTQQATYPQPQQTQYPQQMQQQPQHPQGLHQARNGLGIAALCCGLVGILLGLIPFLFIVTGALAILAIVFGFIGIGRARSREATNRGMSIGGVITGLIAAALAIWGVTTVISGLHRLNNDINNVPNPGVQTQHYQQGHGVIGQDSFISTSR